MSNVKKTLKEKDDDESDSDSSDSDDEETSKGDLPRLDCTMLPHKGCINRVRVLNCKLKIDEFLSFGRI
jgi:hypothetical protein